MKIKNVSRFSRYIVDGVGKLKELKGYNIPVIFETGSLNSLNGAHDLTINMLMTVAQESSRHKSESIKYGIERLQENGGWSSGNVFGYDRRNGFLSINPDEAKIVEIIYHMYLEKEYGTNKIARYLNENEIPTKKNTIWTKEQVKNILKNQLYIGTQITHKVTSNDINVLSDKARGVNYKINIHPRKWIKHEKPELRIIDKDYFKRAQQQMSKRAENFASNKTYQGNHILSNLIVCGSCNSVYRRKLRGRGEKKDKLGYYWVCGKNDTYGKETCNHRYAFREDDFINFVKRKILDLKQADLTGEFEAYLGAYYNFDKDEFKELKDRIKEIEEKLDLNFELFHKKVIKSEDDFIRRNEKFQNEKSILESQYNRMLNHEYEIKKAKESYNDYLKSIKEIDENHLTNEDLKKIFRRIVISPYGRSFGKNTPNLLLAEFNYNFINTNIDKLIDDINEKTTDREALTKLLRKIRFCNVEPIFMSGGKRPRYTFPDKSSQDY